MKLNAAECKGLRDDLDEVLDAVRELKHELGNNNEEVKSSGDRHHKKSRNNDVDHNKKNKANNRRNH